MNVPLLLSKADHSSVRVINLEPNDHLSMVFVQQQSALITHCNLVRKKSD